MIIPLILKVENNPKSSYLGVESIWKQPLFILLELKNDDNDGAKDEYFLPCFERKAY